MCRVIRIRSVITSFVRRGIMASSDIRRVSMKRNPIDNHRIVLRSVSTIERVIRSVVRVRCIVSRLSASTLIAYVLYLMRHY